MLHSPLLFLGRLGGGEILVIVLIIVLLFGAKRIPELFRGMGQGVREFKDATKENQPQYRDPGTPPVQPPYQQAPFQQPQAPYQQPANPNDSQAPRV